MTINALAAADEVIITVNPQLLAMMGMQDFLRMVVKIRKRINPGLGIAGILMTMCESRTKLCKVLTEEVAESFQEQIRVFEPRIPYLSEKEQEVVSGLADMGKIKLDVKTAKCVRGMAGNVTEETVLRALDGGKGKKVAAGRSVRLSAEVYERYFGRVKPGEVAGIVEDALAAWFGKGGVYYFP